MSEIPGLAAYLVDGGRPLVTAALRAMPYAEYLQTEHWKAVRAETLRRCKYRCVVCLGAERLEAHHINYANLGDERPEDTVALCREHHEIQHDIIRHIVRAHFEASRSEP